MEPSIEDDAQQRIAYTRKVLYDPKHTSEDYVNTYTNFWAKDYNRDGQMLGLMAWEHAANTIEHYMPNKDGFILDFCGGTGQCGKRLHEKGYKNLHISDGSSAMISQAMALGVYKQAYLGIVERDRPADYLIGICEKYDVVLSSMSLSEFQPFVENVLTKVLKPSGIFIALETLLHIEKNNLNGITWVIEKKRSEIRSHP